jgi:hypothetical protein
VPLLLYPVVRAALGVMTLLSLLVRPHVVRRLPWSHVNTLARTNRRAGVAVVGLLVTSTCIVLGFAAHVFLSIAVYVGALSLLHSWWTRPRSDR